MKIIFLDIDGVLITGKLGWDKPDPQCVRYLNMLTTETEAPIVVSSCWRIGRTVDELRLLLAVWGVQGKVVDKTSSGNYDYIRGQEIAEWLATHPTDKYVILDDDSDMGELLGKLIQTDFRTGLQEEHIVRAAKMLGQNSDNE